MTKHKNLKPFETVRVLSSWA